MGSGEEDRIVQMVPGIFSGGMAVISRLAASTHYEIEVAAITSAGTGPYSEPIFIDTKGKR